MKALAVRQPFAELIATGKKRVEYRSWFTRYRGDIVIVASANLHSAHAQHPKAAALPRSCLVCIVELYAIEGSRGAYEWQLRKPRRIVATPYDRLVGRVMTFDLESDIKVIKLDDGRAARVQRT